MNFGEKMKLPKWIKEQDKRLKEWADRVARRARKL